MIIDIIGAGIGGLTTAIALEQKGIKTRIFEQAEQIKPVGAGIILANNAMQVYRKIGLKEIIEKNGNPIHSLNITDSKLKVFSKVDLTYFERKYGVQNITIHRGILQKILVDILSKSELNLNSKLKNISQTSSGLELEFENKNLTESKIVLGADGLNSKVRRSLFLNTQLRHTKQVCWRGIADFKIPVKFEQELNEAWGKTERFGFVKIAENKVYWYATKEFKTHPKEFSTSDIGIYFETFHSVIREIVSSTPKEHINTTELSDLNPIDAWYKGNVCLIGDAAHAATPNMGQGACQAIEDAYILSNCLEKYDIDTAFAQFQKLRSPKVHRVVNTSWRIGKLAHWKNPISRKLRNAIMTLTPNKLNRIQSESIFKLETV